VQTGTYIPFKFSTHYRATLFGFALRIAVLSEWASARTRNVRLDSSFSARRLLLRGATRTRSDAFFRHRATRFPDPEIRLRRRVAHSVLIEVTQRLCVATGLRDSHRQEPMRRPDCAGSQSHLPDRTQDRAQNLRSVPNRTEVATPIACGAGHCMCASSGT
jgi:hypothetical protein